jgi:hypothetical protein
MDHNHTTRNASPLRSIEKAYLFLPLLHTKRAAIPLKRIEKAHLFISART